jgi:hypothetical protein
LRLVGDLSQTKRTCRRPGLRRIALVDFGLKPLTDRTRTVHGPDSDSPRTVRGQAPNSRRTGLFLTRKRTSAILSDYNNDLSLKQNEVLFSFPSLRQLRPQRTADCPRTASGRGRELSVGSCSTDVNRGTDQPVSYPLDLNRPQPEQPLFGYYLDAPPTAVILWTSGPSVGSSMARVEIGERRVRSRAGLLHTERNSSGYIYPQCWNRTIQRFQPPTVYYVTQYQKSICLSRIVNRRL